MEGDQPRPDEGSPRLLVDISWVANEARETPSIFSGCTGWHKEMFYEVEDPNVSNWEIRVPPSEGGYALTRVAVFRYLRVTLSQLHPNSMAFLWAFQGEKAKGKASKSGEVMEGSRFGWVSFRQRKSLFRMYEDSIRGFKERYYVVRLISAEGWKRVCYRGPRRDANEEIVRDPSGAPVEVDYGSFSFYWNKSHYDLLPRDLTIKKSDLSPEEVADYKRLEDYVGSFPQVSLEDSNGNLIRDEAGRPKKVPKLIDTKKLLACKTDGDVAAFFLEMSSAQARLRQAKNAKKKVLEAAWGSHSMPASSSVRPNPSTSLEIVETVAEKRAREEEMEDTNSSRQHRSLDDVDDFLNSSSGLHRLQPGKAATQFVYPPIYAHDPIFDDQTEISISKADTDILSSMGPTAIRAEIAKQSVAVFKLLEMVTFLNGRECHYLQE
ncbi:hypothetical protein L195_g026451, partial [Trifolium pratense]